jgi:hypothetical protein
MKVVRIRITDLSIPLEYQKDVAVLANDESAVVFGDIPGSSTWFVYPNQFELLGVAWDSEEMHDKVDTNTEKAPVIDKYADNLDSIPAIQTRPTSLSTFFGQEVKRLEVEFK